MTKKDTGQAWLKGTIRMEARVRGSCPRTVHTKRFEEQVAGTSPPFVYRPLAKDRKEVFANEWRKKKHILENTSRRYALGLPMSLHISKRFAVFHSTIR